MNLNNMKLAEQLIVFVELSVDMSFTKTAERIGLSKGYISKQIKKLEKNLNVTLFYRTTRLVTLTTEGEVILKRSRKLISGIENIVDFSNMQEISFAEELSISCPISFGQCYIADICNGFSKKYPNINLQVKLTNRFMALANDKVDVVIRVSNDIDGFLVANQITTMQEIVCASPKYLDNHPKIINPKDLDQHNCMYFMNPSPVKTWRFCSNNREFNIDINGNTCANIHQVLLNMAIKDKGIVRLPIYTARKYLATGELKEILTEYKSSPTPIYAGYLQHRYMPLRIRLFIDYLLTFFRDI